MTSELILQNSIDEAPVPSNDLSTPPEFIVESLSTLGLKSKQSPNGNDVPVISEV